MSGHHGDEGRGQLPWHTLDVFSIDARWDDQHGRSAGGEAADLVARSLSAVGMSAPDMRRIRVAIAGAVQNLFESHRLKQRDISISIRVSARAGKRDGLAGPGYGFFLVIRDGVGDVSTAGNPPPGNHPGPVDVELFLYPEGN